MRNKKIEFYKHNLSLTDKNNVRKVLDSIFLTTGEWVKEFEKKFSKYLNIKYVVTVNTCTDALELSLRYFNIGKGDEVITTPLSFIATSNVIEYCGAKPVFVDVEESTGNINADLIESKITSKTKAIMPVHLYGHMCDMKKIRKIANKYSLKIIEDAAHCIEGKRDGIRVGQYGNSSCFSFYATKNIASGEGGAIATNDKKMYEWLLKARQHGMSKNAVDRYSKKYEHYDMEFLGFKCNMTNIQASLLFNQLDNVEKFRSQKELIAKKYNKGFQKNENIKFPMVLEKTKHARHIYTIWVDPSKRDEYLHKIQNENIGVAVNFRVIHLMKYYKDKYGYKKDSFPIAEKIGDSTITIPLYPKLTEKEINYVIKSVNNVVTD
ncbi:DegT/DnrJ/EryC1/StrS family aminotransferase [Candidatus Roizmanbacteria bacterium]|nr:DegT/DnrJ/EryC1/StrS family aminotransferase [Candidatus Roizmanbacteria bacterium]